MKELLLDERAKLLSEPDIHASPDLWVELT